MVPHPGDPPVDVPLLVGEEPVDVVPQVPLGVAGPPPPHGLKEVPQTLFDDVAGLRVEVLVAADLALG